MFQTSAVPSPVESLSFSAKALRNSTSLHFSRRAYSPNVWWSHVIRRRRAFMRAPRQQISRRRTADSSSDGCDFTQIYNAYETLFDPKTISVYNRSIGRMISWLNVDVVVLGITRPIDGRVISVGSLFANPPLTYLIQFDFSPVASSSLPLCNCVLQSFNL
ncbi:hypothetical protein V2J09_001114 [Rumex salicifolius]